MCFFVSFHELDGVLALSKSGPARPIILNATDVSVYYGEKEIVHNVSIEVQSGELVAIIGPNGSGKSTMLKAFARLADKKGEVKVLGQSIESLARKMLARSIAYMPQKVQVTTPFRVIDIVLLGRYPWLPFLGDYGVKDVEIAQRCLSEVGMEGFDERLITTLSGGEMQRVFLAQCLAQDTSLLLLDEPTSALDPKHSVAIMKVLQRCIKDEKAALCVMHDINLALRFADKIALMKGGIIHCLCNSKEIDVDILSYVFDVPWHIEEWQGGRLAVPL